MENKLNINKGDYTSTKSNFLLGSVLKSMSLLPQNFLLHSTELERHFLIYKSNVAYLAGSLKQNIIKRLLPTVDTLTTILCIPYWQIHTSSLGFCAA